MLQLVVDDRESAVIPFFAEEYNDIEVKVKRLQIGDYAIMQDNNVLLCIERKTFSDLSASIRDGRINNTNKLISLREQTGCKLIYLIESNKSRYKPNKKFARIPYKNLLSKLDHLMIRDNIHVIYSVNEVDTVSRLIELATNYISLNIELTPIVGASPQNEVHDGISILTTTIPKTDLEIIYLLWSTIPNITTKTATLFIDAGYHISDLFIGNITKADISTMKYKSGTIIGARAAKILKICDNDDIDNYKHYCNMLATLPMITKKTAVLILLKVSFNDLLRGKLSEKCIADIKKTEKTKVGATAAKNIYKFLIK